MNLHLLRTSLVPFFSANIRLLQASFLPFLLFFQTVDFVHSQPCGKERWEVKTLQDSEASSINYTPIPSSVHEQLEFPKPAYHENNKRDKTEKKVYRLECILLKYKSEEDNDWHLVIQDPDTKEKMVAEIPDPEFCPETKKNTHFKKLALIRKRLIAQVGPVTNEYRKPPANTRLIITGVGFFDKKNHPKGFKGRELHPVIDLKVIY